jgi:hypothetical protein
VKAELALIEDDIIDRRRAARRQGVRAAEGDRDLLDVYLDALEEEGYDISNESIRSVKEGGIRGGKGCVWGLTSGVSGEGDGQ